MHVDDVDNPGVHAADEAYDNDNNSQTSGVNTGIVGVGAEVSGVERVLDESLEDIPINQGTIDGSDDDNDKISNSKESYNGEI